MALRSVVTVILLVIIIKMAYSKIWADPSRTFKSIDSVDAMVSHGVYLRNIGTLSTTLSEYKIILPFSTDIYDNAFKNINLGLKNMMFQYNKYFNQTSWPEESFLNNSIGVTRQRLLEAVLRVQIRLNSTVVGIQKDFITIQELLNNERVSKRVPRGLFDFIGKGLNYIFGIATQDQIDETNQRIINTRKYSVNVIESTRHLASIIKAQDIEITDLQHIQVQVLNNTLNLIQGFKRLVFGAAAQTEEILKLTLFDKLNSFEKDTTHTLTTLYRKINSLGLAVQEAIGGKLSSILLPPEVLHKIILDLDENLPPHFSTLQLSHSNRFFEMYNLLKVDIEHLKDGRKIFGITIPIVNNYEIFNLIFISSLEVPFSDRLNSTSKINIKNNKIYAINRQSKKGFEVDNSELEQTKKFGNHFYAKKGHYIFEDQSKINCILSIQAGEGKDDICTNTITPHSNISEVIHLEGDRWHFSIRGTKKIETSCFNEREGFNNSKIVELSGFGELRIPLECTVFFEDEVVAGIFKGTREVEVPGVSKIITINVPTANLAGSKVWENFSKNLTIWESGHLDKMELGLKEELGFQYKRTALHNKTSKLLKHVQKLMSQSKNELEYEWTHLDFINNKEGLFVISICVSLLCNIIMYFVLRARMRKHFIQFLKRMNE